MTALVRGVALLLAGLAVAAAARAVFVRPVRTPAEHFLLALTDGLLAQQRPDGVFDPYPAEVELPKILRTVPHALATAALARAESLGLAEDRPALRPALRRALDVLIARQQPGGTFGGMPPGKGDRWPSVDGTAAGLLALALVNRASDREVFLAALAALERAASVELRDGWTRALAAMAIDVAVARGGAELLGRDPRSALAIRDPAPEPTGRDAAVAEAIVRRVLRLPGSFPEQVTSALADRPPLFEGARSDLQAWWMQAWLSARVPGAGAWPRAYRGALEEALDADPEGRIGESWYADEITQGACAVLGWAEVVRPVGPGPFLGSADGSSAAAE